MDVVPRRPLLVEDEKDANADPPRTASKRAQIFEQSLSLRNCLATFVIALLTPFRSGARVEWSPKGCSPRGAKSNLRPVRGRALHPEPECGAWVL